MKSHQDDWRDCHPNTITKMVASEEVANRRQMLKRVSVLSALAFSAIAGTTMWRASRVPTREERDRLMILPISCSQVAENFGNYYEQDDICDALSRRIACHLKSCSSCNDKYEQQYG